MIFLINGSSVEDRGMYKTLTNSYCRNCISFVRQIQQQPEVNDIYYDLRVLIFLGFKEQEEYVQQQIDFLISTITNKCNKYKIKYNEEQNKQVGRFSVLNHYTNEILYRATSRSLAKAYCERNNLVLI